MRVYEDAEWRIRDILGHIATWDREVSKSLGAYRNGTEYFIPDIGDDETDFNKQSVKEQGELSPQRIVVEWKQARAEFIAAIDDIPLDKYPGDLLYPWGNERGSIARLVEYMIEHEEEHRTEMVEAVQKTPSV